LLRGLATVVRRYRSPDVLLLRGNHGAVPGDGDRVDPRRHPLQTRTGPGASQPRAHHRVLLRGNGFDELRLAVPGTHRSTDFAEHLEHGDLATQLALTLAVKQKPGLSFSPIHN